MMNQSQFLAITRNLLKAWGKWRVKDVNWFGFAFHWLENWRQIFRAITNCRYRQSRNYFRQSMKTVLWMWTSINAHAWFLNANCPNVNAISWPIDPTMETWLINSSYAMDTIFVSFAQWHYRSQWGSPEARLLLIENFSQYPAKTTWNIVGFAIFDGLCVGPTTN